MQLVRRSKHCNARPDKEGKRHPGRVRIVANSSLRKMMRAARRGLVPAERLQIIATAMQSAVDRA